MSIFLLPVNTTCWKGVCQPHETNQSQKEVFFFYTGGIASFSGARQSRSLLYRRPSIWFFLQYQLFLQYKEYPYLNRICRRDTSSSSDPFIQACHGISDYYEAAILYHAYDKAKNNAAAQTELQRMNACEASYPDYEEYFRDIDQLLASY